MDAHASSFAARDETVLDLHFDAVSFRDLTPGGVTGSKIGGLLCHIQSNPAFICSSYLNDAASGVQMSVFFIDKSNILTNICFRAS